MQGSPHEVNLGSAALESELAAGAVVAAFTIQSIVARGPLAAVYRACRGDDLVALKLYPPGLAASEISRRIVRERHAHGVVDHPCVARLLDWGCLDDGSAYLATEWVDGCRLEDRLGAGPLAWADTARIVGALGAGLAAIHDAGIVHRDLKPANVLLPARRASSAVIVDFGHSLLLDSARVTEAGLTVGSAAYMAPEQACGAPVDARADLYAVGVILYRALTGELPHDDSSAAELLRRAQVEPVVPPSQRNPGADIPAAADDLCLWLLAKQPAARLPSARVLVNTLRYIAAPAREVVA